MCLIKIDHDPKELPKPSFTSSVTISKELKLDLPVLLSTVVPTNTTSMEWTAEEDFVPDWSEQLDPIDSYEDVHPEEFWETVLGKAKPAISAITPYKDGDGKFA